MKSAPLTRERVEKAKGVALNLLVAEHVMGFVWRRSNVTNKRALYPNGQWPEWMDKPADMTEPFTNDWSRYSSIHIPNFQGDHNEAFKVVAKICKVGWELDFDTDGTSWEISACHPARVTKTLGTFHSNTICLTGESLPILICRVAVIGMGKL